MPDEARQPDLANVLRRQWSPHGVTAKGDVYRFNVSMSSPAAKTTWRSAFATRPAA